MSVIICRWNRDTGSHHVPFSKACTGFTIRLHHYTYKLCVLMSPTYALVVVLHTWHDIWWHATADATRSWETPFHQQFHDTKPQNWNSSPGERAFIVRWTKGVEHRCHFQSPGTTWTLILLKNNWKRHLFKLAYEWRIMSHWLMHRTGALKVP